jgi:hypothetical protein
MRKSSPPPRRKSPQSPSIINRPKSEPLPARRSLLSPTQTQQSLLRPFLTSPRQSPSIINRPKSEPLPARRSLLSPTQTQQSLLRPFLTSPRQSPQKANLSSIPDDLRLRVLDYVLKSEKHTLLNNELIERLSILAINKNFKETIKPYFEKIHYIALQNITITKDLLGILKMMKIDNKKSIVLRGISFDSPKTLNNFLEFLSTNDIVVLVLDNILIEEREFKKLLEKLKNLKNLYFFEINNSTLQPDTFKLFIKVVTNSLKSLNYLQFTNNTVGSDYDTLFTVNKGNIIKVDKIDYNIYMSYEHADWEMKIKNVSDPYSKVNTFSTNVSGNSTNVSGNSTIMKLKNYGSKLSFKVVE